MDKAKQVAAIYEERLANMIREKKMEEEFWRTERQNHLNELMALKQQCTINAKVCLPLSFSLMQSSNKKKLSRVLFSTPLCLSVSVCGCRSVSLC